MRLYNVEFFIGHIKRHIMKFDMIGSDFESIISNSIFIASSDRA
jgi:hypothetical protein